MHPRASTGPDLDAMRIERTKVLPHLHEDRLHGLSGRHLAAVPPASTTGPG